MNDNSIDPVIRQFVRDQTTVQVDKYSDVGGVGAVYFGERIIFKDRVAMKFYPVDPFGLAHSEPYLLKNLEHDNILKIHHAEIISNQFAYYLTPEISGGDLQEYLEKNVISTDNAFKIITGVLNGLAELHNRRLVHRDLKTFNILIDAITNNPVIADFGFVRQIPGDLTSTTASSHTHLYRSKEMIEKNEHTFQSDIYQIGVIVYQILGGCFPFEPLDWLDQSLQSKFSALKTVEEQIDFWKGTIDRKVSKNKLLDYNSLPPYVDAGLKKIIAKAVHPDLSKRYKTCVEFKAAIFHFRKNYKNWWIDGTSIHAENKKGDKRYIIENYQSRAGFRISINNSTYKNRNVGNTLNEMINYINQS